MDDTSPQLTLSPLEHFGHDVRKVREGRKITQKALGKATGYSESYVSKVEAGVLMPSRKFAEGLDRVFGTNGLYVSLLARLDESSAPSWFIPYLRREAEAEAIMDFSTATLMGLVQTPEYARAIFRAGFPRATDEEIEREVAKRMLRQSTLARPNAPTTWLILHESCLRTVVGGPDVMASQLESLTSIAKHPAMDIQVLPFTAGAHAAHIAAFTILRSATGELATHMDDVVGGRLFTEGPAVEKTVEAYERLRAHALAPDASLEIISNLAKEYET
ncbi:helix-turn-helix domain-containing protein [Streptomyces sp. 796.1]|uniref:helix-turn-helix domain-containing protein n=1 Tax=Streptomyces sp. 796.1 TaxID=3163029 RepID=UPI0039C911AD